MFRQFYHLERNPFDKTLPVKDAFDTKDFKEANARLDFLVKSGGIGLVTAAPGYGKTFAMRAWSSRLNRNVTTHAYICLSTVSTVEFYRQLCQALGLEPAYKKSDMFRQVQDHLYYESVEKRMQTVITIDEAQYLSIDILRDLKMIANFDMDSRNCVAIALVGQPSLADTLSRSMHEALRQRIVVSYSFSGLGPDEAQEYTNAMIRSAGGSPSIFDPSALAAAYGSCQGSIRRLNAVLTNALRIGAQAKAVSIDAEMVLAASSETNIR